MGLKSMGPEEIFKICRNLWCKTPWEIKAEIFSRLTYLSAENLKEENLMRFEIEPVGNSLVVKLYGEIDQHCVGEIRNDIDRRRSYYGSGRSRVYGQLGAGTDHGQIQDHGGSRRAGQADQTKAPCG